MNYKFKLTLCLYLCYLTPFSFGSTTCTGEVKFAGLNPASGLLLIDYGYGTQYQCKVGEVWNEVPPESCKAFYSMLLAAQMSGKKLQASYNDDFECSSEGLGHNQVAKHIMYRAIIVD